MAGKGLKPNTLLPWRSSLFIEVTRGTATSPGRDAILSQLTPLPPPSPSATVFFHIPPFVTTHFCYPLPCWGIRACNHWTYDMSGYFVHCSYFFLLLWGMENMMQLTKYPVQTYYMFNHQIRCIFPWEVRVILKVKMSCPRTQHNGQTKAQQLRTLWLQDGH